MIPADRRPASSARPHETITEVEVLAAELAILLPQLGNALARDGGAASGERVSTSASVKASIVNPEVEQALIDLSTAIPLVDRLVRDVLQAPSPQRAPTLGERVAAMPGYHQRLIAQGFDVGARRLVRELTAWCRTARRAIGLITPDTGFHGRHCPLHDSPLSLLRVKGDEAELHETVVTGRYAKITDDNRPPAWHWRRSDTVFCPDSGCRATWEGPTALRVLGALLDDAMTRRAEAEIAARYEKADAAWRRVSVLPDSHKPAHTPLLRREYAEATVAYCDLLESKGKEPLPGLRATAEKMLEDQTP